MNVLEEREPQKKKNIAFRATPSIPEDDESMDGDEADEFAMLDRKIGKLFYKKGRMCNFQIGRTQGKSDQKKEEMGPCYHCKKNGHLITNCPSPSYLLKKIPNEEGFESYWG